MTTTRPGRPRAVIAPLTEFPEPPLHSLLKRLEDLLTRIPLNERAALGWEDAAIYLSVGVDMVRQLEEDGFLTRLDVPFKRVLFLRADIDAYLASCRDESQKVA